MAKKTAAVAAENLSEDETIIKEAKNRFATCSDWESDCRNLGLDDLKFANADSDNMWQWPDALAGYRVENEQPCLTINRVRQHCLNIINDAKQNKPGVSIRPISDGATFEAADVFEGIVRHIEYRSNAQVAYDTATKFQVESGIGYWRVVTDWADEGDTFNQDIFIQRVKDPRSIYIDPDIRERDGSDAMYAFVFDDLPKDKFDAKYPKFKDKVSTTPFGNDDWLNEGNVRVAEYFRRVEKTDRLVRYIGPDGNAVIRRASKIDPELMKLIDASEDPETKIRDIVDPEVQWFLIVGDKIADRRILLGKYIPIVRVIGEETFIDGKLDRKGHVRNLKDAQRNYNYWASAAVEQVALQSKSPWITDVRSIEGYETYWADANRENFAYLPYKSIDDKGQPLPKPERAPAPTLATAFVQGMSIANEQMMIASGQFQADFGEQSNEKSGVAIQQRQRAADNSTYHFVDNLAVAIRFTGRILLDLIPKIYDTPRVLKILGEDGAEADVMLDPQAKQAHAEQKIATTEKVQKIFNPNIGIYDVEADIGPAYATKRQEAFNAFSQIISQNREAFNLIGDLMFSNADFPGADEIAERLRRMVPPQALGDGPPPEVQQAQQQVQHFQGVIAHMTDLLAQKDQKIKAVDEQKDIDVYRAETDRMKAVGGIDPAAMMPIIRQMVMQVLGATPGELSGIIAANSGTVIPSQPGGFQQGPSGLQQGMPAMPVPASGAAPGLPQLPQN